MVAFFFLLLLNWNEAENDTSKMSTQSQQWQNIQVIWEALQFTIEFLFLSL